jgi:trehalose-6-phosphate synthase
MAAQPTGPPLAADVLVVSNREPYEHVHGEDGVAVNRSAGGLSTALDALLSRSGGDWLAWGSGDADFAVADDAGRVAVPPADPAYTLHRLDLPADLITGYYEGYSNQVLWPLAHGATDHVAPDPAFWDAYEAVNERFAAAADRVADGGTVVWFQDYHLSLAPRMLREGDGGRRTLAQFWHVPWPTAGDFEQCPHPAAHLDGLLANDVLGFHTEGYLGNFADCVERWLPSATVDRPAGRVRYRGGTTALHATPAGVDPASVAADAATDQAAAFADSLRADHPLGDRVAVSVDRLDYTKGVVERLRAFERLWTRRPDLREAVSLLQKVTPTREGIAAYREYADRVEAAVDRVNGRFGTDDWQPVVHLDRTLDREELAGVYRLGDVCVVSPRRDGLNLVAEEYVAAVDDGVLVLSEFAGVSEVLGDDALLVDPDDPDGFADVLARAFEVPPGERRRRLDGLRAAVEDNTVGDWTSGQFRAIRSAAPVQSD